MRVIALNDIEDIIKGNEYEAIFDKDSIVVNSKKYDKFDFAILPDVPEK